MYDGGGGDGGDGMYDGGGGDGGDDGDGMYDGGGGAGGADDRGVAESESDTEEMSHYEEPLDKPIKNGDKIDIENAMSMLINDSMQTLKNLFGDTPISGWNFMSTWKKWLYEKVPVADPDMTYKISRAYLHNENTDVRGINWAGLDLADVEPTWQGILANRKQLHDQDILDTRTAANIIRSMPKLEFILQVIDFPVNSDNKTMVLNIKTVKTWSNEIKQQFIDKNAKKHDLNTAYQIARAKKIFMTQLDVQSFSWNAFNFNVAKRVWGELLKRRPSKLYTKELNFKYEQLDSEMTYEEKQSITEIMKEGHEFDTGTGESKLDVWLKEALTNTEKKTAYMICRAWLQEQETDNDSPQFDVRKVNWMRCDFAQAKEIWEYLLEVRKVYGVTPLNTQHSSKTTNAHMSVQECISMLELGRNPFLCD
jgi:hypothetical protein